MVLGVIGIKTTNPVAFRAGARFHRDMKHTARFQSGFDGLQMSRQIGTVGVEQAEIGPDAIIGCHLCQIIKQLLAEVDLPADKFEIEVTESAMLHSMEEITATLEEISALGVRISLDDFGTGFSSLSYLHTMPFDKVKIDKSFIDNGIKSERSLTLLRGVVDLIKRLGLSTVLEGIETMEQLELMHKNVDVNEVQGYLFASPMPYSDIISLLGRPLTTSSQDELTA